MALAPTEVGSIEETTAIRLVAAHRCGDRDAFAEIVRSHYPSLLATARHRLGNAEDAKDAVQETLVRALLALDRFGDTGDWRLGAWLNTILIHVCADIPARRKPTVPLSDWLMETCVDEDPEPTSDHVALAAVRRAIGDLPEPQRRAFELRLVDGRSYDEVAGALGITEVNARARVRRARAALRNALESTGAVSGAFAAVPLALTGPFRSTLRRIFAGARDSAAAAGSQTAAYGAVTTTSSAGSAIAGTPLQTGIQLLTQVSATPLGQAVVASATGVPAKGSVVLGIVASLATAGGLTAPAVISGSTAPSPPAQAVTAPATATGAPAPSLPAGSTSPGAPGTTSAGVAGGTSSTGDASAISAAHFAPPTWMTLAMSGGPYKVLASSTVTAGAPAPPVSSTSVTTSPPVQSPPPPAGSTTSGTSGAGAPTTTGTASSPPVSSAAPGPVLTLPIGTCTGVTGFPGVTAPTTLPALSSSNLDAVLSTGALSIANVSGSPAFAGTAVVNATAGSTSPVHVKVGTCLADGGSILAVDMTGSTGDEVQLVGALVAQPIAAAAGVDTYLFRGEVTQLAGLRLPGGRLPWGLAAGFVAEV